MTAHDYAFKGIAKRAQCSHALTGKPKLAKCLPHMDRCSHGRMFNVMPSYSESSRCACFIATTASLNWPRSQPQRWQDVIVTSVCRITHLYCA